MEPVDGLSFLKALRAAKLKTVRETPVVFLTADAKRDTVLVAKELRVNGYLVKPVALSDLRARIDAVLTPPPPLNPPTSSIDWNC
jgi:two-component system chemotaxis response regulator CheY